MKPASARRISSHADGPDVARARGRPATSAPNGPISSARSVPRRGRAPAGHALVRHRRHGGAPHRDQCRRRSRNAVLIVDQAGWHLTPKLAIPDNSKPGAAATIARVEPGGECLAIHAPTGCRTGSSNPTKTSSRCAAKPGTTSSTNHGRSCPSACANGRKDQ